MIRLCVFDLDGTTVDSLASIAHFANLTLEENGFAPFPVDDYRHLAGGGARKLWQNIVNALHADPALQESMMKRWLTIYEQDFLWGTRAYDGVPEMLNRLKELGVYTAIITNKAKPIAEKICFTLFGEAGKLLDECISDHPGMTLKPAPDEILHLMDRRGVSKDECLYSGDHTIDMQMARNAGVIACGVTWGFHTREALLNAGADHIADHPRQIVEIVKSSLR